MADDEREEGTEIEETFEGFDEIVTGVPIVHGSGLLVIDGDEIALWGLLALAPDQQCWENETAWNCGEQATSFLRHFLEDRRVECHARDNPDVEPIVAQCFRLKDGRQQEDVAASLIENGWAIGADRTPDGPYAEIESLAREARRGIWSSRFQTAQDWIDGVQRFVDEQEPLRKIRYQLQTPEKKQP